MDIVLKRVGNRKLLPSIIPRSKIGEGENGSKNLALIALAFSFLLVVLENFDLR